MTNRIGASKRATACASSAMRRAKVIACAAYRAAGRLKHTHMLTPLNTGLNAMETNSKPRSPRASMRRFAVDSSASSSQNCTQRGALGLGSNDCAERLGMVAPTAQPTSTEHSAIKRRCRADGEAKERANPWAAVAAASGDIGAILGEDTAAVGE